MKYLKIGTYEIWAFAIIAFATVLRIVLDGLNWPITNSDEGTMGIIALHIAYHGEHPYVFYGQFYMGTLEAYIGAILFHLFGPSLFVLRLSVILLVALFLVSMYLLTSLLYSKKLALVTLTLLSLGSNVVLTREIISTGGSSQTLLFGSLAFLLAAWLALTSDQNPSGRKARWRLVGFSCWGLVIGLGLWSDLVVLPFFAMATLFLVLFCWRDLWSLAPLCLIFGLIIGASPLIVYNFKVLHGVNSLSILLQLFHGTQTQAPRTLAQIIQGIKGTILVSLPTATGNPFCPVSEEWQYFRYTSPHSTQCTIIRASWGLSYLVLWAIATFLTVRTLWQLRFQSQAPAGFPEGRRTAVIRHLARLMLLGSAALALTAYALSSAPMGWPGIHARYLIGLLIITPAIVSPLWSGVSDIRLPLAPFTRLKVATSGGMLLLIGIALLIGTIETFSEDPLAQTINQQQNTLVNALLRIHATHIYSEYWTCDNLIFRSNEQIICVVVDTALRPDLLYNRYQPYIPIVVADSRAAYVFPIGSPQAASIELVAALPGAHYRHFIFDSYVVYQPQ
jgi:hypothetical protein